MARLVFVTIPAGKRDGVLDVLEDEGIDYTLTDETSRRGYTAAVHFPLPTNAVESVLDRFRDLGLDDDAVTVVVDTQTVVSREFEALEEASADGEKSPEQIAGEELQTAAEDLVPASPWVYVGMTVVSAVIATAGLLLDSAAVVVGSMVIAPLIGPSMAAAVGTVFQDRSLFRDGVKLQVAGGVLSIASAALFAALVKSTNVVPPGLDVLAIDQVRERFRPDVLSLVIALGSGAAGVISLASGLSSALVGVMIAVALVPPAATVGIGIAWGQPSLVLGSSVLLLVNVLSINLAALLALWYMGYRPPRLFRVEESREEFLKRTAVLVAGILLLSSFLGGVSFASYQTATIEQTVRDDVTAVLEEPEYAGYVLLEVEFEYTENLLAQRPSQVTVLVGAPPGRTPPNLAARLDRHIDAIAGRDVAVQVRYLTVERPS